MRVGSKWFVTSPFDEVARLTSNRANGANT